MHHDIETNVKLGPFSVQLDADRKGWFSFQVWAKLQEGTRSILVTGHKCSYEPDEDDDPNGIKTPEVDREGFLHGYWHRYPWYWSLSGKIR